MPPHHYAYDPQRYHIVSAVSADGIGWKLEPGARIAQDCPEEAYAAYSLYVWRGKKGGLGNALLR